MSSCLESEALVALAGISEDPERTLRHLLECDECRASITDIVHLRAEFAGSAVRVGFVDDVMTALPGVAHKPHHRLRYLWWLAEGGLAAGAALFVAAAAGSASPGALGPTVLPLAALVGLAVAARSLVAPLFPSRQSG